MIARHLTSKIKDLSEKFPVISLTGPRQSGKTTLLKETFPQKKYISLEDPDMRRFAIEDPRGFLASCPEGAILDEVQRVPDLFSYLQGIVDDHHRPGEFILSGSQNFLLMESITQSLAGRVAILKLFPFSNLEMEATEFGVQSLEERIFTGCYPRIYDLKIDPEDFYPNYVQTYVERDLRQLKSIHNLELFLRFLRLCAARLGQLLNVASLAADCGISHYTAQSWLSLLQTSYIVYLLPPHFENFSKRLVKMPKLYFYDTGLACHLLSIKEDQQLVTHSMRGPLFENMIVNEWIKYFSNSGREAPVFFWRDKTGHELDLILELPKERILIEIKSSYTFHSEFLKNFSYYHKIGKDKHKLQSFVIYAGEMKQKRELFGVLPWKDAVSGII